MTWFEKIIPSRIKTERRTRSVPEGLWMKCPTCDSVLYRPEVGARTWLLWFCPGLVLLGGTALVWHIVRRRAAGAPARAETSRGRDDGDDQGEQEW